MKWLAPFLLFALCLLLNARAQNETETLNETVLLRKEHSFGILIHSQGYGLQFRKGINKDFYTKWLYESELLVMKSERETRVSNDMFSSSRSYSYGKLNSLLILRAGAGQQRLLNRKPEWGGIEVRYFWNGGASLGMAKPIYLNIIHDITLNQYFITYSLKTEKYDPAKHNSENIYGDGDFFKGFDELSFHPGLYGKLGLSFDFSKLNQTLSAIEVGGVAEYFPKAIPIMANRDPEHFFLTFYISAHIGKRYN